MRTSGFRTVLLCAVLCACKSEKKTPDQPPAGSGSAAVVPEKLVEVDAAAAKPPEPADASAKVQGAMPTIKKIAADPAVVKAVQAQNGKKMKLDDIKALDKEWSAARGVIDKMKPYLESGCAKALAKYTAEMPALVESFAMDNQGAIVCATSKTSDFWQGDEDKWQKSYADGKGAEFIDKPKFDDSSQTYSVQVSVPVSDGKTVIGALTVGLAMDKL